VTVPRGRPDFQLRSYVEDATVYLTPTVELHKGTLKRVYGRVSNGLITIYIAPAGVRAHMLLLCVNVSHYAAGAHYGEVNLWDGSKAYPLIALAGPDAADQMSEALAGGVVDIPSGWELRVYANAYSTIRACALVSEYAA